LSPAEIIEEALKLPISEQEEIFNRLAYNVLGELANSGDQRGSKTETSADSMRPGAAAQFAGNRKGSKTEASATWQTNPEHSGIEIKFSVKPSDEVLNELRQAGFRWHKVKKLWYVRDTPQAREIADRIAHFEGIKKCTYKNAKNGPKCSGADESAIHDLKPGDILYTSWGYEQTNVEWFKVYEIRGRHYFYIKQIGSKAVEGSQGCMSESRIPEPERVLEGEPQKAYCSSNGRMHVCEHGYQRHLYLWDGSSKYCSWYA